MLSRFHKVLSPVRLRQRLDRALRWTTIGLLLGAVVGVGLVVCRWLGAPLESLSPVWAAMGLTGLGALAGLAWPTSWQSSARMVDAAYDLKDRTLTALEFAERPSPDPIHTLQLQDALTHLSDVDARRAAPWRTPRLAPAALGALMVMLTLLLVAYPPSTTNANLPTGPLDVVLDQAALLEETLIEDLEELSEETDDPEIEKLVEEMKQAVEELKEPDVDQHEALAQLSEMQTQLATAMKQLDTQRVDAELQDLAEALQDADATKAASDSLRESEYDKAAEELEKIDASTMDRKQRKAVKDNLAKLSSKLGQGKKGSLSESVQDILEGLEKENSSKCKSGFCKAAGVCKKQGIKKRISDCLACQLNRLSQCKGSCQGQGSSNCTNVAKSDKPSNKAGRGASNKPFGDQKTKLDSQRRDENLTGAAGDGPSERETLASAEARQDAARSYRQRYAEYRKQMEEVLDSEPLPLGHRETVRKYFESIRPSADQEAAR